MSESPLCSADMIALIRATWNHQSQGGGTRYLVAEEVNNGAGFSYQRTIDAVVFDTWPSQGLVLHGLEVKVSASDFRRELVDIEKSAAFTQHLDTFSIVAPVGIVDMELLPAKWGLYNPDGKGKLKARRRPVYLHDLGTDRKHISRSFAAAFSRALLQRSSAAEELRAERERIMVEAEERCGFQARGLQTELDELRAQIEAFEDASGVHISRYENGAKIGAAVAFILSGGIGRSNIGALRYNAKALLEAADALEEYVNIGAVQ